MIPIREFTSKSTGGGTYTVPIDGKVYTLKPAKKTKAMLGMMTDSSGDESGLNAVFAGPKAMMTWFEYALNREHGKNPKKKIPGHGKESVEGCQACDIYDRLDDDDDPLELDTIFEVANELLGEMSGNPTGSPSA